MKKISLILLLIFLNIQNIFAYQLSEKQIDRLNFTFNKCENYKQSDIPTIFIPGILASWYSEEGFKDSKIKRWIPDPITHVYDTLFKVFSEEGKYDIKDVFYINEFETYIDGNPKQSLYLFGYDWKKDNKITAKLLRDLILKIRLKYEKENGCDIATVNILAHSMGGLIARSMLENMCASDYDIKNYYKNIKKGEIKNIKSSNCYNFTKINKFITISTPQRGSPNSFPMWEKGDLLMTNTFIEGEALKTQLGIGSNKGLYEMIHGYNKKVVNGIVTIGQLLPDLKNQNKYNEDLKYLFINDKKVEAKNYSKNSFLEELNSKENIEQMFKGVSGKYSMYYSELTGNKNDFFFFTKNNITGYDLKTKYFDISKGLLNYDNTKRVYGKDIYNKYEKKIKTNIYNIANKIFNEKGLGGDGTVPTKNLKLVANNDINEVNNSDKFESINVSCIDEKLLKENGYNLEKIENKLTKKLGDNTFLELCSHTKMSILSSIRILDKILGNKLLNEKTEDKKRKKEQKLLYKYLGYIDYTLQKTKIREKKSIVGKIKIKTKYDVALFFSLGNKTLNYLNTTPKTNKKSVTIKITDFFCA